MSQKWCGHGRTGRSIGAGSDVYCIQNLCMYTGSELKHQTFVTHDTYIHTITYENIRDAIVYPNKGIDHAVRIDLCNL